MKKILATVISTNHRHDKLQSTTQAFILDDDRKTQSTGDMMSLKLTRMHPLLLRQETHLLMAELQSPLYILKINKLSQSKN